ncbi:MAG TPA: VOC family protein [Verrucomicrobiota bacterium]|nr:VOC family protein [Verrucomicrobiota bacterium]
MTAESIFPDRLSAIHGLVPATRPRAMAGPLRLLRRRGSMTGSGETIPSYPVQEPRDPVLEIFVRDLERSVSFYTRLGFLVEDSEVDTAELVWGDRQLRLRQPPRLRWAFAGEVDATPRTHLRLVVADVDAQWQRALELNLRLVEPLTDHPDGTRDFMLADPDGFGLRFVGPSLPERNNAE